MHSLRLFKKVIIFYEAKMDGFYRKLLLNKSLQVITYFVTRYSIFINANLVGTC